MIQCKSNFTNNSQLTPSLGQLVSLNIILIEYKQSNDYALAIYQISELDDDNVMFSLLCDMFEDMIRI